MDCVRAGRRRSCRTGKILGTFAIYASEVREPAEVEAGLAGLIDVADPHRRHCDSNANRPKTEFTSWPTTTP